MIKYLRWIPAVARLEHAYAQERQVVQDLREANSKRSLPWPRPTQRLKPHVVRDLIGPDPSTGTMQAVHQVLDDQLADLLDALTMAPSATMTEAQRLHQAGGAEALRQLQAKLMEIHQLAKVGESEEGEEDGD